MSWQVSENFVCFCADAQASKTTPPIIVRRSYLVLKTLIVAQGDDWHILRISFLVYLSFLLAGEDTYEGDCFN